MDKKAPETPESDAECGARMRGLLKGMTVDLVEVFAGLPKPTTFAEMEKAAKVEAQLLDLVDRVFPEDEDEMYGEDEDEFPPVEGPHAVDAWSAIFERKIRRLVERAQRERALRSERAEGVEGCAQQSEGTAPVSDSP